MRLAISNTDGVRLIPYISNICENSRNGVIEDQHDLSEKGQHRGHCRRHGGDDNYDSEDDSDADKGGVEVDIQLDTYLR